MAQDDKRSKQLEADEAQREADKSSAQRETDRYRQAAEDALQQLDWCIGYLHGIHKLDISRALAKNRSFIRTRLMGEAEQPVPGQQTSEK